MKFKESCLVSLSNFEINFLIDLWSNLKKAFFPLLMLDGYIAHFQSTKNEIEKLAIWKHYK